MTERIYQGKRRSYQGYPLPNIIRGVIAIQRRHRVKLWNHGLEPSREQIRACAADDLFWYLAVQGFNSASEFRAFLAARTSPAYADRLLNGSLLDTLDRRARKERTREYHQYIQERAG
jgi:hypothetical protein